jgi:hypothetical protein
VTTERAQQPAPARAQETVFSRVLLKLSGEALMGDLAYGADAGRIASIAA